MAGQRVYQVKIVHDVRREALAWLSNDGLNHVLWETCELVWDSADLLSTSSGTDQMAVFGIKGVLVTLFYGPFLPQQHGYYHFSLRYVIDYSAQPRYRYRMHVSVKGPIGMPNENTGELHLFQKAYPRADSQQEYIETAIRTLTYSVDLFGSSATFRLFLS